MKYAKQLGYNYFYHYNEYTQKWFCIHKDSLNNYFERNPEQPMNWCEGQSPEEAATFMTLGLNLQVSSLS